MNLLVRTCSAKSEEALFPRATSANRIAASRAFVVTPGRIQLMMWLPSSIAIVVGYVITNHQRRCVFDKHVIFLDK